MSKKASRRILDENGRLVPFPAETVVATIEADLISEESLQAHQQAVEEIKAEQKSKHGRKIEKTRNDQAKKREDAAFEKILDA